MSDEKKYMIRVYTATVETKHGVDRAQLYDDPVQPLYTRENMLSTLMNILNYEESEETNDDIWTNGLWDGYLDADFEYEGYEDIEIPDTIVQRIIADASK